MGRYKKGRSHETRFAIALALMPTFANAGAYSCNVAQIPAMLTVQIDRATGHCQTNATVMRFVSGGDDFVCALPEFGWTFLVAPDNSWALFDENSDMMLNGRCTPI